MHLTFLCRSEDEKETWSFLSVLFGDDPRRQLLKHLNFEPAPPASAAAPAAEESSTATAAATNGVQDLSLDGAKAQTDTTAAVKENGEEDGLKEPEEEDFFEKLPSTPPADTKVVEPVRLSLLKLVRFGCCVDVLGVVVPVLKALIV